MINQFSNAGMHHLFDNAINQDAISTAQNNRYVAISLADGVSTCTAAQQGAIVACNTLNDLLINKAAFFFQFDEKQVAEIVISHILYNLRKQAAEDNEDIGEYSSTISSVLIDTKAKKAVLINLGDGIILAMAKGKANVLAMPDDSSLGCCVTTTMNAINSVAIKAIDIRMLDSIAICSDGAWRQMFNKNKLKPEVANILGNSEYDLLSEFLLKQKCFDDFSFVSVDLKEYTGRKTA